MVNIVKLDAWQGLYLICFVEHDKTSSWGVWGGFLVHDVHADVHQPEPGLQQALKAVKNMVFGLVKRECMNVFEGYRSLIAKFALSVAGVVKQTVNVGNLVHLCFTAAGWDGGDDE